MIVTDAHSRVQLQSLCAPMPGTHAIARVLLVAPPVATVYMRVGDVFGGMCVLHAGMRSNGSAAARWIDKAPRPREHKQSARRHSTMPVAIR
ncbi:hypothetical protein [Xanthomonas euroxanthea]|uniref:hypothetical protein n=1 Tax=Xanthomonas euroxanthea TaxID=2259622 RepID=UPI0011C04A63|nr:hypothetical protein [Xanthomonas euroxanthea]CAE1133336.1 hypothetical protein XTG_000573 [Xanthomonas euroxanthea]